LGQLGLALLLAEMAAHGVLHFLRGDQHRAAIGSDGLAPAGPLTCLDCRRGAALDIESLLAAPSQTRHLPLNAAA
jgi:hypothetical protein